jgi:transcriptional antiterminator NusG
MEQVSPRENEAGTADAEAPEEHAAEVDAVEEQAAEEEAPEEQVAQVEAVEEQPAEKHAADVEAAEVEAVEEQAAEPQAPPRLAFPDMDWYIIHTYSGFENKVKESLRTRADAFGFGDRIGEILIPTEDVVEMRSGKKVRTKRLLYPGYVLVQLQMDDELWHVVRNTPRVTSFVGSGQTPTPLTADEVNQILYRQTASVEKPRPKMTFEKNDRVKIIDGPFSNFAGTVEEVNEDRNTLKVMVTIFGRGTPVELEYFQVEKEKV